MDASSSLPSDAASRELERLTHATLDSLLANLAVLDEQGVILMVNRAWRDFGRSNSDGLANLCEGANYLATCEATKGPGSEQSRAFGAGMRGLLAGELDVFSLEYPCHAPDEQRWFIGTITRFLGKDGAPRLVVSHSNITHLKRTEAALRESEARSLAITESVQDAILMMDPEGRVLYWNSAATQIFGYTPEEAQGQKLHQLIVPERFQDSHGRGFLNFQKTGEGPVVAKRMEQRACRKDGRELTVEVSVSALQFQDGWNTVGIIRDTTQIKAAQEQQRQAQAQLEQAQRMESLGCLAGGVAHDMNNVLGAILGWSTSTVEEHPVGSPTHRAFSTISMAAVRGGKMVKSLLRLARQGPLEDIVLDLNGILREALGLLERTTLTSICLEMDLAEDLHPIFGDSDALNHAFLNLFVNASDAMPERGILRLRSRNLEAGWVEIQIADTGCGMPKEVLERALDPFYTTKGVGKGTGLGLSLVYRTVQDHGGELELQSEPGQGTTVIMRLPVQRRTTLSEGSQDLCPVRPLWGDLKVLLVDDDELMLRSMEVMLKHLGHGVVCATSGEEALGILETGFQPDVALLDMSLPGLGTTRTLVLLRVLQPPLKIVLVTGRVDQASQALMAAHAEVSLLPKPFSMAELQEHLGGFGRRA